MSATWDRTGIDRFVRTLHLRNPMSVRVYTCVLHRFQCFVVDRTERAVSSDTVRARW